MADKHSPIYMKAAIVFLILASLGLGVGLMMRHKQAVEVSRQDGGAQIVTPDTKKAPAPAAPK